jgi:low affinity Fe/Cu permease
MIAPKTGWFSSFAKKTSVYAGKPASFGIAVAIIFVWGVTGPMFGYSDTWQLVINTGTTIITFLMVFLIQNSQNRDSAAIQLKLDELIRVQKEAKNSLIGLEERSDEELEEVRANFMKHAEQEQSYGAGGNPPGKSPEPPHSL